MRDNSGIGQTAVRFAGRPPVHSESWSKVTVVLLNRQIAFLDRISADIRATSGAVLKRAEIIRALIEALAECGQNLRDVRSESDLKRLLRQATSLSSGGPEAD